jgi:hypothetical protein
MVKAHMGKKADNEIKERRAEKHDVVLPGSSCPGKQAWPMLPMHANLKSLMWLTLT